MASNSNTLNDECLKSNNNNKNNNNKKIEKDNKENKDKRERNTNEASKICINNKQDLQKLETKLELALEEEKKLIEQNKILWKEKERLEKIIKDKGIDANKLVTKEELNETAKLQKELKELF